MREQLCRVVDGGRRPGKCIEIGELGQGNGISFTLDNLDEDFDGQTEFTRISYLSPDIDLGGI